MDDAVSKLKFTMFQLVIYFEGRLDAALGL